MHHYGFIKFKLNNSKSIKNIKLISPLISVYNANLLFCLHTDPSHAQVIGIFGSNITLQFTFNVSINDNSQIGIYITGEKKIDDFKSGKGSFVIYPQNNSVFYHITNLTQNHTNTYWASLFGGNLRKSNEVKLTVEERNISCTSKDIFYD